MHPTRPNAAASHARDHYAHRWVAVLAQDPKAFTDAPFTKQETLDMLGRACNSERER